MRNKFLGTGEKGYHPLRKLRIIFSGLRYAVLYDFSVAYKVVLSLVLIVVCFYFRSWIDFVSVTAATGVMLVAEMFNTTIEALCDFVEAEENDKIGAVKDIAAAAAGIGILIWLLVMGAELRQLFTLLAKG